MNSLRRLVFRVFGLLPRRVRRNVVRAFAPSYTVGAMCLIERGDGALLLVRHSYRRRWGVPGGLAERGEEMTDTARREAKEEIGVEVELVGEPAVVVAPEAQRVDVVFRARLADGVDPAEVRPCSAEITETGWFPGDALPELQFETATALQALARQQLGERHQLPEPRWPDFVRGGER